MRLVVDKTSQTPVFQQIVEQVVHRISIGDLPAGARLPTVRGLAEELGIAPNTVAKAYRQLEEEGHVQTQGRNGTLVSGVPRTPHPSQQAADSFVFAARSAGLDLNQAIGVIRRSW